jgi:hypothetical protein
MANPIVFPDSVAGNPCLLSQFASEQLFRGLDPSAQMTRFGALNALISEKNRSANSFSFEQSKSRPTTANKQVSARYMQYICDTSDLSSIDKCDLGSGDTPTYLTANYGIEETVFHKFSMDDETFRTMCETPTEQFMKWYSMNVDVFLRKLDKNILNSLLTHMGNYPIGVNAGDNSVLDPLSVNLLSANGTYQPTALALVQEQFEAMGIYGQDPIIVGKGYLSLGEKIRRFSGIDANGINTTYTGGLDNVFIDDLIDRFNLSDGSSRLLAWAQGAIQLLTWNEFTGSYAQNERIYRGAGDFPTEMELYKKQWDTIELLPGLTVDFLYQNTCEGMHTWALKLHYSVVSIAEDAFASCQDFNYALNFDQACGTLDCSAISSFISNEE